MSALPNSLPTTPQGHRQQLTVDWDTLRYLEGIRTPLEVLEIWRLPVWQWCDRVVEAPELLGAIPPYLAIDIRQVVAAELDRLPRTEMAALAQSWGLPYSGPKAKVIQHILTAGPLLKRLDSETEESLAALTVPRLNELLVRARFGKFGNKSAKIRKLLAWRRQVLEQRLRWLAAVAHRQEVYKARSRGETIPEFPTRLTEDELAAIRARRLSPEEIDRRIKALYVGIPTQPGDLVRIEGREETYVVEGENPQGLLLLRCRETTKRPLIAVHRCHLRPAS